MNVIVGGKDAFDACLYPPPTPDVRDWIGHQFVEYQAYLTDMSREFFERARRSYEELHSHEAYMRAQRFAQAAMNQMTQTVYALTSLEMLRHAPPFMQRWVMACPEVSALYDKQRCAGYPDSYSSTYDGVGEDNYHYRRVMHGMLQEDDEGHYFKYYLDDLGDDRPLSFMEQCDVLRTWDYIRLAIESQEDPTDPLGGSL